MSTKAEWSYVTKGAANPRKGVARKKLDDALEPMLARLGQLDPMAARGLALRVAKALREGTPLQEAL